MDHNNGQAKNIRDHNVIATAILQYMRDALDSTPPTFEHTFSEVQAGTNAVLRARENGEASRDNIKFSLGRLVERRDVLERGVLNKRYFLADLQNRGKGKGQEKTTS